MLSPRCHIELFLAAFFIVSFRVVYLPAGLFTDTTICAAMCCDTQHTFKLLSSPLSPVCSYFFTTSPSCSRYPGCFPQTLFQLPFCDKHKGGFFGAISPLYSLLSFHSPLTFFLPFSNLLSIICPVLFLGFPLP